MRRAREGFASRVQLQPERERDESDNDRRTDDRRYFLRAAAARRIVGGVVEFSLHHLTRQLRGYRKTARPLSQSDWFSRSWLDGAGCAALTGSDAGKLSISPASNFSWISRSACCASRG